jgi:uncharacterized Zn finger protein/DNA-binding transcriptional regulator YiaG
MTDDDDDDDDGDEDWDDDDDDNDDDGDDDDYWEGTNMGHWWPRYVPVGERRHTADKEMAKLAKKGVVLQPVRIEGTKIAKTFWGKAWCEHLESFSDYENRLPRGRTYVRNGSVCHLEMGNGELKAKVSGSELYTVTIGIKRLKPSVWAEIKKRCSGEIGSLLDLLGGKLADGVMEVVTDREHGLFPRPREITMDCSCPDRATMCKHIAAVLYGVGARLDERPELLFFLRGVNHDELISAKVEEAVERAVGRGSGKRLRESDLSEIFGIEMEEARSAASSAKKGRRSGTVSRISAIPPSSRKPAKKKVAIKKGAIKGPAKAAVAEPRRRVAAPTKPARTPKRFPPAITGIQVAGLRKRLGLTGRDFAIMLGVSAGAVSVWERSRGGLNLQERSREALREAWEAESRLAGS